MCVLLCDLLHACACNLECIFLCLFFTLMLLSLSESRTVTGSRVEAAVSATGPGGILSDRVGGALC